MTRTPSPYHQRIAADNRESILEAATELFFDLGYDRTSLTRVADIAGVSKATLFKQFPAKADLFEAAVLRAGYSEELELPGPVSGDPSEALILFGHAYSDLLIRPRISALIRTIIAESPRFPELRDKTFDFGTYPILNALRVYLEELKGAGIIVDEDLETVSSQFLGIIASATFWPRLIHGTWSISEAERRQVVVDAAETIVARYVVDPAPK